MLDAVSRRPGTSSRYTVLGTGIIYEMGHSGQHFHILVQLIGKRQQKQVVAMIDSGAATTFISRQFVVENCVATRKLDCPIVLYNIIGTHHDAISDVTILELQVGEHCECMVFMVTDIGAEDVIIGRDWLRKHNPNVDWDGGTLRLSRCPE